MPIYPLDTAIANKQKLLICIPILYNRKWWIGLPEKIMIQKYFLFILTIILSISFAQQRKMELEDTIKNEIDLKYLFFLPKDYYSDKNTGWPLILFLHGMGERGADLELVKIHGIPKIVKEQIDFPFIAVSPQCPIEYVWRDDDMQQALENL